MFLTAEYLHDNCLVNPPLKLFLLREHATRAIIELNGGCLFILFNHFCELLEALSLVDLQVQLHEGNVDVELRALFAIVNICYCGNLMLECFKDNVCGFWFKDIAVPSL